MSLHAPLSELRRALRSLARVPAFTLLAALTLGLGIGAVTLVFSAVSGVLLRPLPYAHADRIGILWHELGEGAQNLPALNALDWRDYRERGRAFEDMTMGIGREVILTDGAEPELVDAGLVASNFFSFLGVAPRLGRDFRPEEDDPGSAPAALLTHGLWQRRYGGDPALVGRTILLEGQPVEVAGVLPPDFALLLPAEAFLLTDADLYLTARVDFAQQPPRNFTPYTGFVRLKEGVGWEQAQADLARMAAELRAEHAVHEAAALRARVEPLHADVVKGVRPALLVLMASVALVLLVACGNLAHLFLARSRSRERDLAVMAGLGAGRARLAWAVMAEGLVVAALGSVLGTLLALGGVALLRAAASVEVPRVASIAVDARVLGFVAALGGLSALLFGLLPALQAAGTDVARHLREGGRSGASPRQRRLRSTLVGGEVALSIMLLVAAGLLMRSFVALQDVRPGFQPEGVLTFRLTLPRTPQYAPFEARLAFWEDLRGRLAGLPGVRSVSGVSQLPLTGTGPLQPFAYDDASRRNWESVTADRRIVFPGFFENIGAELVAGRGLTDADRAGAPPVIVIDEQLAALAWPGQDAVGKLLQVQPEGERRFAEVVGVVRHLRLHELATPHLPQIYVPYGQAPAFNMVLTLRVAGDPAAVAEGVRRTVRALGTDLPVNELRSLDDVVGAALAETRFSLVLMAAFAGLALLLSGVGLYAVIAFAVAQRRREIGVRLALGETPAGAVGRVVREGMGLVAAGTVVGLLAAGALGRLLAGLLHGVEPADPLTFATVATLMAGVALLACWVPARRAARVDPASALRGD